MGQHLWLGCVEVQSFLADADEQATHQKWQEENVVGRSRNGDSGRVLAFTLALALAGIALAATSEVARSDDLSELSLEELGQVKVATVYGASKHEQKLSEAPSAVSIVTADEIKKYGDRTLADVLRGVRGFYVTYDRAYTYIGVRGVNRPGDFGGRVLITIDGHRVNEPIYDSAFNGTEGVVDVDLIDRVEVIRGPGSSLYGNNAFFTVINIVTKRGRDYQGAEVSGSAASYDTYSGRLTYGNKFENGVELVLSGSYLDSQGHDRLYYPEFSSVNNGIAEHLDGTWMKSFFATLSYRDFTLEGAFVDRRKDVPTASFGTVFNARNNFDDDRRAFVNLTYRHEFDHEWEVMGRVYYDDYRLDASYPYDYLNPLYPGRITINRDLAMSRSLGTEAQVSKVVFEQHRLTAGAEFRYHLLLDLENFDVSPPAEYVDSDRSPNSYGFYLQDEFSIRTNLVLNAGGRYDHFSTFGDTLNPRAALLYSPARASTLKFLYGQAFRAPNEYELSYIAPGYKANPRLDPEKIRSYELVYEQELGSHLGWASSLFFADINSLINQVLDPADGKYFFSNVDSVQSRGVETELEGHWARGLRGRVSYTYTQAEAKDAGSSGILDNSPQHLAKLNLIVPLYAEKIFAGLEVQGMTRRQTVRGGEVSGFWLANLTLFSRELVKGLEISASVYNLFDRKYRDPVSPDFTQDAVLQDGRNFRVKLEYRF